MKQEEKRIAIVGGGPGGLTLAKILVENAVPCTVFELDGHALARPQGGSLDLHAESGLRALKMAGLWDEFQKVARYDDQYDALYDRHGTLHFEHAEGAAALGDRPEIDRTQLRELLLASLPAEIIRWNSKISSVVAVEHGKFRVLAETGSLGDFDLVVGADGAWSKVRPLVSAEKPAYTGVFIVELNIERVDELHPAVAKLIPHGKISIVGESQAFIAQRSSKQEVRVYLMLRAAEDWLKQRGLAALQPASARAALKAEFSGFAAPFLAFIDASGDRITPRPIYTLPPGHGWEHRAGVTLIGDAAHVMPPFSGEGVNMAMLDALELGLALTHDTDWEPAITRFESAMFARAKEAATGAIEGLEFVSDRALEHVLEHFRELGAEIAAKR